MIYTKHARRRQTHKTSFVLSPEEVHTMEYLQYRAFGREVSKAVVFREALKALRNVVQKGHRLRLPS